MRMGALDIWLTILMLTVIVLVLRNLFLFAPRRLQPRGMFERALRYAPLAALSALVGPEVFREALAATSFDWRQLADARVLSAATLLAVARLSGSVVGGLAAGTAVFLLA